MAAAKRTKKGGYDVVLREEKQYRRSSASDEEELTDRSQIQQENGSIGIISSGTQQLFVPIFLSCFAIFVLISVASLSIAIYLWVHGTTTSDTLAASIQSIATVVSAASAPPPSAYNQLCSTGEGIIGSNNISGWVYDDCDALYIVLSRFVTPNNLAVAQSTQVCVFFGNDTEAGADSYKMAIYADDGFSTPTQLLGSSLQGTINPNNWNCLPVSAPLGGSMYFWMAVVSNGNNCGNLNNLYYMPSIQLRSGFTDQFTWPDFPLTLPTVTYFSAVYGMYLDYNASCITPF